MRGNYTCRFPASSALGRLEPARHCGGFAPKWAFCSANFLYLCVLGAAIAAPFLFHPHWAFFKRPIACSGTVQKKRHRRFAMSSRVRKWVFYICGYARQL